MRYRPTPTTPDRLMFRASATTAAGPRRACRWLPLCLIAISLIGGCSTTGPAPVDSLEAAQPTPPGYYRVRPGETLYRISLRHKLNYRTVARWNHIPPPYHVNAGRLLRMEPPGGQARLAAQKVGASAPGLAAAPKPQPKARQASTKAKPAPAQVAMAPKHLPSKGGLHWSWPMKGEVVQRFRAGDRMHRGIRIKGRPGELVKATEAGKVVYSGSGLKGYGNLIIVKHNSDYLSAYGFNRRLLVKEGDQVSRGQSLAEVGQVPGGDYLLHFEIRRKGTAVDPLAYLPTSQ
jgi:lipoprotein NlpD